MYGEWNVYLGPFVRTLKTDVFPEGFIHKEKVRVIYEDSDHDLYFFRTKARFLSLIYQ